MSAERSRARPSGRSQESSARTTPTGAVRSPAQLIPVVREQLSTVRATLEGARHELVVSVPKPLSSALERWIDQGEELLAEWAGAARRAAGLIEATQRSGTHQVSRASGGPSGTGFAGVGDIKGVGVAYAETLAGSAITTTADLIEACSTDERVDALSADTGIPVALLRRWSTSADLTRIKDIGPEYLAALNAAGIATVGALADANAPALRDRLSEMRRQAPDGARVPSPATLERWIGQATTLRS